MRLYCRGLARVIFLLALAVLAIREHSIRIRLTASGGRLELSSHGATVDLGPVPGERIDIQQTGPQPRRSPAYLLREEALLPELRSMLFHQRLDEEGNQAVLSLGIEELANQPVFLRLLNPVRPGIRILAADGRELGFLRFYVLDRTIEAHTQSAQLIPFSPPLLRLMATGLAFACLIAFAVGALAGIDDERHRASLRTRPPQAPRELGSGSEPGSIRRSRQWILAFALGAAWIGWVHYRVIEGRPGFGDEMNYLVQAKIIASGHFSLSEPEQAPFFRVGWTDLMAGDGKIWDFHPIGNSLLLAIGLWLGSASFIPPLVGGGVCAALFLLARELSRSNAFAWLSVAVVASSHYFVSLIASFMAHGPALLFVALGYLALVRLLRSARDRHAVLLGVGLGSAFLMRPLSGLLLALIPMLVVAVQWLRGRLRTRTVALAVLIGLSIASIEFWRTYATTGQLTLGYLAKGPEAEIGLAERWARGWEWRVQNLYTNYRFYHDRLFGLGPLGNFLFLLVPLSAALRSVPVALAYLSLVLYTLTYSFLHFFGWQWEPRMLFECSLFAFLLTAYGMWTLGKGKGGNPSPLRAAVAGLFAGGFFLWNFGYDLPERLRNEYPNYNDRNPSLDRLVEELQLHHALVLHRDPTSGFAPRMPENELQADPHGRAAFGGDVLHAIHLGALRDQELISRHPTRRVFYMGGEEPVEERVNFYRQVLPRLAEVLSGYSRDHELIVVIPWLRFAAPGSLDALAGAQLMDDESLLSFLAQPPPSTRSHLVAVLAPMSAGPELWGTFFSGFEEVPAAGLEDFVHMVRIDPATYRPPGDPSPAGLTMNVYDGVRCLGDPARTRRAGLVEFDAGEREDLCVDWSARFVVTEPAIYSFALTSDDGSAVFIDGKLIADNNLLGSQGRTRRSGEIFLEPGPHTFYAAYTQHSAEAYFEARVRRGDGPEQPITLTSFGAPMRSEAPDRVVDRRALYGAAEATPEAESAGEAAGAPSVSSEEWPTGETRPPTDLSSSCADHPAPAAAIDQDLAARRDTGEPPAHHPDHAVEAEPPASPLSDGGRPRAPFAALGAALFLLGLSAWLDARSRRRSPDRQRAEVPAPPVLSTWRAAGIGTCALFAVLLVWTQSDYGETWDEFEQFETGEQHYQYLFGNGDIPSVWKHENLKYYGPLSDTVAASLNHLFNGALGWLSFEQAIHLHLNLLYVASGFFLFRVLAGEHGAPAAWLALMAYFLSPRLVGDSHNNMKDFPATAWMLIAVLALHVAVGRRSHAAMAIAGAAAGLTIATKINGLLLAPVALSCALLILCGFYQRAERREQIGFVLTGFPIYAGAAAAVTVLCWPWLWEAPLARFIETARFFADHTWKGPVLYRGEVYGADALPWHYAPYYLLITTPTLWLPFLAAGLVRVLRDVPRRRPLSVLLAVSAAVPVLVEIVLRPPVYDGIRHFLQAVPFVACLVGLGMDWTARAAGRHKAAALLARGAVAAALVSALVVNLRLHPYQVTYFNLLVGGVRGASGRFELDYWGSSLKEVGRWVNRVAPPESRVHVILGLERLAKLRPDLVPTTMDPDYAIVLGRETLAEDPYREHVPEYTVVAGGAVLAKAYHFTPESHRNRDPIEPLAGRTDLGRGVRLRAVADGVSTERTANTIRFEAVTAAADSDDRMMVWEAYVDIPRDGLYSFLVSSDRRSRLHLGGVLMLENHPTPELWERVVRKELVAGTYPLRVEYWPGNHLELLWKPPGDDEYAAIPAERLSHQLRP
jgi:4-amino-4-deoxy-L-arabinose transferase-like glycosyltransferase